MLNKQLKMVINEVYSPLMMNEYGKYYDVNAFIQILYT